MKEYIVKADFITEGDELVLPEIVGELIRCKDCKFYGLCVLSNSEDGFCAWAKPKEEKR